MKYPYGGFWPQWREGYCYHGGVWACKCESLQECSCALVCLFLCVCWCLCVWVCVCLGVWVCHSVSVSVIWMWMSVWVCVNGWVGGWGCAFTQGLCLFPEIRAWSNMARLWKLSENQSLSKLNSCLSELETFHYAPTAVALWLLLLIKPSTASSRPRNICLDGALYYMLFSSHSSLRNNRLGIENSNFW